MNQFVIVWTEYIIGPFLSREDALAYIASDPELRGPGCALVMQLQSPGERKVPMRWKSETEDQRRDRRLRARRARGHTWRVWFAWYPTRLTDRHGEIRAEKIWLERYFYRSKDGDNRTPWIKLSAVEWFQYQHEER